MNKYCLVSTTGDLASNGMSDNNTVIPFNDKYFPVVKEFLIKQEIWHISGLESYHDPEKKLQHIKDDLMEYMRAVQNLYEAGIFSHKYEARTEWRLVLNTEYELEFHKPYKIEKKNNLDNWFADHVEIIGGTKEVRKTVEKKIKDGLINGVKK